MYLSKILLQNFRSYDQKLIEFDAGTNLIVGPNGSGKTNILEAIFLLNSGKSFRASSLGKLIAWNQYFASVRAKIQKEEETEIEVKLIADPTGKSSALSRKFLVDKVEKPRKKYLGILKTVVFQPEDIRLVNGSPGRRRDFLDEIFTNVEWRYASALSQYNKALKHRNELLDLVRSGLADRTQLFFWDQSLIKNANIIHDFRTAFIRHANQFFVNHENPEIRTIFLNYHPSALSAEKLERNYDIELIKGYTQSGVHRDDFSFDNLIFPGSDKNLADWGSRGQQRLAVLALRLAQIDYFETTYKERPILLLDDIFSELDPEHQNLVTGITKNYQTFFTSSESSSKTLLPHACLIELSPDSH
ncbi:MAG TPA: DNA replication and repair protein RecF [Patescibacteria group bacterium]